MWKPAFRKAIDPEKPWSIEEIRELLREVDRLAVVPDEGGTRPDADEAAPSPAFVRSVLRGTQPMAAALGATLHSLTAPGVFEDDQHLVLLGVYAHDIGVGAPNAARFDAFQRTLAVHGLTEDATTRAKLSDLPGLADELFTAPAVLLALSRRPDCYLAELLGADLHLRGAGLLAPWSYLARSGVQGEWARLDPRNPCDGTESQLHHRVHEVIDTAPIDTERVRWGGELMRVLLRQWEHAVWLGATNAADPRAAMIDLMRRRSREAAVYHNRSRLADRTIQEWFADARENPSGLVDALAESRYVKPGAPDKSLLITKLTDFGGPMFRIFSPEDRDIISRWITSLNDAGSKRAGGAPARPAPQDPPAAPLRFGDRPPPPRRASPDAERPSNIREAYVALQGRHCSPHVRRFANDYIDHWLGLARNSLDRHPFPLPARAPEPGGLREWLLLAHEQHADAIDLEAARNEIPSREDLIESTVQLAPLTLIDGSWLLGFTDVTLAASRIGFSLFETYWDELGNGDIQINHPKLYRDVLQGMGVDLPPTSDPAFARSELLADSSFELPVYWLAIGRFPNSRQPEILGLNLAMELSGVGGSYRTAREALRAHGFSTVFVDIHNTIDNVSTGHSAWAAEAIESFMDAAAMMGTDETRLSELWERVRVGFASLSPRRDKAGFFDESGIGKAIRRLRAPARPADARSISPEAQGALNEELNGPWRGRTPATAR
ncbi:iron-containing redox enzyme family protein [Streptomonospora algeriensis]|uniref:Iron-containing redox enzyme family protein n=1 Tax=Streptomonospora algeriensis TaxID=995084 RepID=A0ABW3BC37_9ACTN